MKGGGRRARGFDRVEIRSAAGVTRQVTRAEFESLPLDRRVRAILNKELRFFLGDQEVPMSDVLAKD